MQQDLVRPNLTVLESMMFAVDLKLGKTKSQLEKITAVNIFELNAYVHFNLTVTKKKEGKKNRSKS